jgi:hypothetical protein
MFWGMKPFALALVAALLLLSSASVCRADDATFSPENVNAACAEWAGTPAAAAKAASLRAGVEKLARSLLGSSTIMATAKDPDQKWPAGTSEQILALDHCLDPDVAAEARLADLLKRIDEKVAAEMKFRGDVVWPMCHVRAQIEWEKSIIAKERANPGGVVDMAVLHAAGAWLQSYLDQWPAWLAAYRAVRHREFVAKSEPGCLDFVATDESKSF